MKCKRGFINCNKEAVFIIDDVPVCNNCLEYGERKEARLI